MTFPPPPPPPTRETPLGVPDFFAPPPEGRETTLDDGRCSSERRGRTPLGGRLNDNTNTVVVHLTCHAQVTTVELQLRMISKCVMSVIQLLLLFN